jgi:hypothetical protein
MITMTFRYYFIILIKIIQGLCRKSSFNVRIGWINDILGVGNQLKTQFNENITDGVNIIFVKNVASISKMVLL